MYLWLCTSQTHSDILAGPRSNGRWYFKETIKQFESSESNYEWEPATLPKDLDLHPGRPPGKVPVFHSLFITLSLGLFSVSSEFSHFHLSQLYGICSNQEAVTLKLTLHGSGCLYDFLPIETRAHLLGAHHQRAILLLSSSLLSLCRGAGRWMLEMPIDNQDTLSLLVWASERKALTPHSWDTVPKVKPPSFFCFP